MNKIYYEQIGETLYTEILSNGLTVYINPNNDFSASYAAFATHYGGAYRNFTIDNVEHQTPAGVAHYLEHKMFDMPEGENALTQLSANGADPNAFTSSGMTCYYFESTDKFDDNLALLLKFVSTPYFTPESVQKEQGIIGQEIEMTEDNPAFEIYINLMKLLYKDHPIRDSVAGTVESISHITSDILYECYNSFYTPSNMCLCVSGNVDPEKVMEIVKKALPETKASKPITEFGQKDEELPNGATHSIIREVSAPQFLFGSRVTPAPLGKPMLHQKLTANLVLRMLFGSSSDFYTDLYSCGLLGRDFDCEIDYSADTATIMIGGESDEPSKIMDKISETVNNVLLNGIDPTDLERAKRASYGSRLRGLEDLDNKCISMVEGIFDSYNYFDSFTELNSITVKDCVDFIERYLRQENFAVSLILPDRR